MAEVFRSEVTWSATSHSNGQPSIFFTAGDNNNVWAIEARRGAMKAEFYFYSGAFPDPGLGTFISGVFFQVGPDFSAYDNGGVLAIEKDQALDQIRFITPLGTEIRALSGFGSLDASPLRPVSTCIQFLRSSPLTQDSQQTVKFSKFFGRRDGRLFLGANLSSTNPGSWTAFSVLAFGLPANGAIPQDNAQESASYRFRLVYVDSTDNPKSPSTREWRDWNGGDNINYDPANASVDAAICPVTGFLYTVRIPLGIGGVRDTVLFGKSTDSGHTLTETAIHVDGTDAFDTPSIAVDGSGRIVTVWRSGNDDTKRLTRQSEDTGFSWSAALTVSLEPGLTVAAMRIRFSPSDGSLLEAYTTDTNIRAISYDAYPASGFSVAAPWSTPKTVAGFQQGIKHTLCAGPNGQWLLGYVQGSRKIERSEDGGITWTNYLSSGITDTGQCMLQYGESSGLFYLLQQDVLSGDITVSVSADQGATFLPGLAQLLVIAAQTQQYAALVIDSRGRLIVVYLIISAGDFVPAVRISEDNGLTWSNA